MGGVTLNLKDPESVQQAVDAMNAKFSKQDVEYHGIMVSEMVPKGLEMMIGAKDVVFNMCPVSVEEAEFSLRNLKNTRLIEG